MITYEEFMEVVEQAEEAGLVKRICNTHDLTPMDDARAEAWEDGIDACLPTIVLTVETLEEHHTWG